MNTYTFTKEDEKITIEANDYSEALNELIWRVESENEASLYIYRGE